MSFRLLGYSLWISRLYTLAGVHRPLTLPDYSLWVSLLYTLAGIHRLFCFLTIHCESVFPAPQQVYTVPTC